MGRAMPLSCSIMKASLTDTDIIRILGSREISTALDTTHGRVKQWYKIGIPSLWRGQVWALLQRERPQYTTDDERDRFLGIHLPEKETETDGGKPE